jgi:selenide,water dikinase
VQNSQTPVVKDLVLVGGGHSHITVLKRFGMHPMPGVRVTMICREMHTPYSGMLPGLIAGHYTYDEAHIDLGPLCRFAGARLYHDEAIALDPIGQSIECRGRPPVRYDVVSFNIGSTPRTSDIPGATGNVVPVKPINQFITHWQSMIDRILARNNGVRIGVVGTGAGGVEILLAVRHRLRQVLRERGRTDNHVEYYLFGETGTVLPDHSPRARRAFERELRDRHVQVLAGDAVTEVSPGRLVTHAERNTRWMKSCG